MSLRQLFSLLRICSNFSCLRFLFAVHRLFAVDPDYSPLALVRLLLALVKNERIVPFAGGFIVDSLLPPLPSQAMLTFLGAGTNPAHPLSSLAFAQRAAPLSTYLAITDTCPYRCRHCSVISTDHGARLSSTQWIRVIGELQNIGVAIIGFTGGEPLLCEDLETLVAAVDQRSSTVVFTSGHGLSLERAHRLRRAGLEGLSVSLDSADEARHNAIRRNSQAFQNAIVAIQNSRAAGLYTIVQPVIFKEELDETRLFALFRLAKQSGAHEVRLHQPAAAGRLLPTAEHYELFGDDDRNQLLAIQAAANRRFDMPKVSSFPYTEGPERFGCGAGVMHSYITAKGELCPCDFIPMSFGNVVDHDLAELVSKMRSAFGGPRLRCCSRDIAPMLAGRSLPLTEPESIVLCSSIHSTSYAGFFHNVQGCIGSKKEVCDE